jgi:hypothetical protein
MRTCAFSSVNETKDSWVSKKPLKHVGRESQTIQISNMPAAFFAVKPVAGLPCTNPFAGGES